MTIERRGLHGSVVDLLGRQIVGGDVQEGETLEPEALERNLRVSRTVIREALKVLMTKGLVAARPRRGTYILQRSDWNLLDADVMAWRGARGLDERLLRDLDEVRMVIEPAGARMAAQRRSRDDLQRIARALEDMTSSVEHHADVISADLAFHQAILQATHNELLDRLDVLLSPALHVRDQIAFEHPHPRYFLDAHSRVHEAIAAKDAQAAFDAMTALLEMAARDTERIVRKAARANRGKN